MASGTNRPIRMCVRLLVALIGTAAFCAAAPAGAATLHINEALCHAVSDLDDGQAKLRTLRFACAGTPADYQQRSLWLRADLHRMAVARGGVTLMVHPSRFDRLAVAFTYADGTVRWQQVRQGDYGLHWRTGGQILFEAPERAAPLAAVTMRFDRLASHQLVRAQLLSREESSMRSAGMPHSS